MGDVVRNVELVRRTEAERAQYFGELYTKQTAFLLVALRKLPHDAPGYKDLRQSFEDMHPNVKVD